MVFGSRVAHCVSETGKAAKSHAQGHRSPASRHCGRDDRKDRQDHKDQQTSASHAQARRFGGSFVVFGSRVAHCVSETGKATRSGIDEEALEGVYFAFSLILRCLPYFCRKTRPRASYDLIRTHSGVWLPSACKDEAQQAAIAAETTAKTTKTTKTNRQAQATHKRVVS